MRPDYEIRQYRVLQPSVPTAAGKQHALAYRGWVRTTRQSAPCPFHRHRIGAGGLPGQPRPKGVSRSLRFAGLTLGVTGRRVAVAYPAQARCRPRRLSRVGTDTASLFDLSSQTGQRRPRLRDMWPGRHGRHGNADLHVPVAASRLWPPAQDACKHHPTAKETRTVAQQVFAPCPWCCGAFIPNAPLGLLNFARARRRCRTSPSDRAPAMAGTPPPSPPRRNRGAQAIKADCFSGQGVASVSILG